MTQIKNNAKEWMWKRIWNNVGGEHLFEDDEFDWILLDPKGVFYCQTEDGTKPFTMYHFITHMEYMREKLPEKEFLKHRDWVFNNHPRSVPSFKQLLTGLLRALIGCFTKLFMRV
jgi:hypothetical protein